jgi:hypothetical protein
MVRENLTIPTALSSLSARLKSKRLFLKIFFNSALSEMLNRSFILRDNFKQCGIKKLAKSKKFFKKCKETVVKISFNQSIFLLSLLKV